MKIEKTYKKDSNVIEITGEDLENHAKETGIPLPRGLKEWKKLVRRCDCDSRILNKLEKLGYEVRFADSGAYVDCENKKGKYETHEVHRFIKYSDEILDTMIDCINYNKEYPIYIRTAQILQREDKKYCVYLRTFNKLMEKL